MESLNFFKKYWGYLLSGIIVVSYLLFVNYYKPKIDLGSYNSDHLPDFSFEEVLISQLVDGEMKWQLQADYAEIVKGNDQAKLSNSTGVIYSDGEDIIQFRSKEAEVELHSSSMRLNQAHADFKISDDVVALSADNILWNPDEKQFIGTNNIVLRSDLATVYGDYFYVNVPFKILKVSKNSRAKVYPSYE